MNTLTLAICLLVNLLVANITPEDHSCPEDKVQGCCTLCVVHYGCHLVVVKRDLADVMSAGKQQGRMTLHSFAAGVVPGVPEVALHTLTLEGALLIDTGLGAGTRHLALVDICNQTPLQLLSEQISENLLPTLWHNFISFDFSYTYFILEAGCSQVYKLNVWLRGLTGQPAE